MRNTPARRAARAGLLGHRQPDALVEGADHGGPLAVARAACDGDTRRGDVSGWSGLQRVDDTAHAPGPGHHRARLVVLPVDLIKQALTTAVGAALRVGLRADLIIVEARAGDATAREH